MADSPSDALQTHKVSGRNSPRVRGSGQKKLKNPENPEKLSPAKGEGGTGVGDHLGTCPPISVSIDGTSPKLLWQIALVMIYKPTRFQVETHPGAGLVGKKVLKIPKKSWKSERVPRTSVSEDRGGVRPWTHRTTEP